MKSLQLRLPDSIHRRAKDLATEERISLNQFIVTSVANEVTRQETSDFFRAAAEEFDPQAFDDALAAVPDVPAEKRDRVKRPRRRS